MVKFIIVLLILFLSNSVLSQFNGGGGAGTFVNNLTILNCGFFSRGGGGSGSSAEIKHRDISCNSYFGNSGSGTLALLLKRDMECNMYMGDSVSGYKRTEFKREMECNMYMGNSHSGAYLAWYENPLKCLMYTASLEGGSGFHMRALSEDTVVCAIIPLGSDCSPLTGQIVEGKAKLEWYTEQEYRNSGFELFRSYDGYDWERVSWFSGQGTTFERTEYQYLDKKILMSGQYYRFKQVDFEGNEYWSNIVFLQTNITLEQEELYTVFPNPSFPSNTLTIKSWTNVSRAFRIEVLDGQGRSLMVDEFTFTKMNSSYVVPSKQLNAGTYYIKMISINDDGEYMLPFVVVK